MAVLARRLAHIERGAERVGEARPELAALAGLVVVVEARAARAQRVGIEAHHPALKARDAAPLAAVAECKSEHEIREARLNPCRAANLATIVLHGNDVIGLDRTPEVGRLCVNR